MKSMEIFTLGTFIEGHPKSRQANYRYLLLESEKEIEDYGQKMILTCFGIEIVREDIDKGLAYSEERERIECMTTYRYKAVQLLKKLYDNCVSPIELIEIAGPIADEWVNDFNNILQNIAVQ